MIRFSHEANSWTIKVHDDINPNGYYWATISVEYARDAVDCGAIVIL